MECNVFKVTLRVSLFFHFTNFVYTRGCMEEINILWGGGTGDGAGAGGSYNFLKLVLSNCGEEQK